jgi:uncharacterized protein
VLVQYILVFLLILLKYQSRSTPPCYPLDMSKFTVSIYLVVAANLVLVSSPVMGVSPVINTQLLAESSTQQNDAVFEDVISNRVEKLKQFIDRGGSPNRYLHAAVNAGSIDCVKLMLIRGANVNLADDEGLTPVMISARATYRGGVAMTELLIKKGANVNTRAGKGSTALMYAAWGVAEHYQDEYVKVVRLLIKHGAQVNVKNKLGASPLSIAQAGKWGKIVAALKKAGAKI